MDDKPFRPHGSGSADPGMRAESVESDPYGNPAGGTLSPSEPEARQSGLGIASFVLALVCILGIALSSVLFMSSLQDYIGTGGNALTPEDIQTRATTDGSLIGGVLLLLCALAVGFVGLILGIVALAMRNRRKVFAIIGTVLNGIVIVGFVGIIILGIAMQGSLQA